MLALRCPCMVMWQALRIDHIDYGIYVVQLSQLMRLTTGRRRKRSR